jgi:hypothetical protein
VTAPIETPVGIEDLDHRPMCGIKVHVGDPTTATHWFGQHGCFDALLCTVCLDRIMTELRKWLENGLGVECSVCHRTAYTLEDIVTVRPL